jgi:hypothetical protein
VDPNSDSKFDDDVVMPEPEGEFNDSVLASESFGGESKLDIEDDPPVNASVHEFSKVCTLAFVFERFGGELPFRYLLSSLSGKA